MKLFLTVVFSSLLSFAGLSIAAEEEQAVQVKTFDELDTNHDGYISKTESKAYKELNAEWSKADTDKNGKLDVTEFSAFESKGRYEPAQESAEPEPGAAPTQQ